MTRRAALALALLLLAAWPVRAQRHGADRTDAVLPTSPPAATRDTDIEVDDRPDDPRAAQLLAALDGELFAGSFLLAARLSLARGDVERELGLRIEHLAPDRTLVQAVGAGRHRGTRFLRHPGGFTAWFPRAELALALPAGAAGQRLFGSELTLEDLGLLMGAREQFRAEHVGEVELDGVAAHLLRLRPRAPALSASAEVDLWLRRSDAAPLRMHVRDRRGELLRRFAFSAHEGRSPRAWRIDDPTSGGHTELRITRLEPEPPLDPARFTPEGLRR